MITLDTVSHVQQIAKKQFYCLLRKICFIYDLQVTAIIQANDIDRFSLASIFTPISGKLPIDDHN